MGRLLTNDYERMLDLATDVMHHTAADPPWPHILEELLRSLHGTAAVLSQIRWTPAEGHVRACTPAALDLLPLDAVLKGHIKNGHPLARHYSTTGDRTPLAITDLVSERNWRHSEAYALTRRTFHSNRHFAIPLQTAIGTSLSLVVHRDGRDFTAHERAYARRLQPLLNGVDAHLSHLHDLRRRLTAAAPDTAAQAVDATSALGLTPREMTVLDLLAQSLTARAIGHRLNIATRTVHKHLEALYRKLGTTDRLATVLRAQSLGLLPPPAPSAPARPVGAERITPGSAG